MSHPDKPYRSEEISPPAPAVYYSIEGRLKVLEQNWKILKRHLLAIIFNQRSLHSCKTLKTTQKLQKNTLA